MTINWNTQKTVEGARKLFDQFRGTDAMSNAIKRRLSDPLGVNFEKDVIEQIGNRFTHVSWFEMPARVNSGTNLVGVKLVDAAAFKATVGEDGGQGRLRGHEADVPRHDLLPVPGRPPASRTSMRR